MSASSRLISSLRLVSCWTTSSLRGGASGSALAACSAVSRSTSAAAASNSVSSGSGLEVSSLRRCSAACSSGEVSGAGSGVLSEGSVGWRLSSSCFNSGVRGLPTARRSSSASSASSSTRLVSSSRRRPVVATGHCLSDRSVLTAVAALASSAPAATPRAMASSGGKPCLRKPWVALRANRR